MAFAGVQPKFDDLYVFHDINTNGSYDAGTDELFRNEDFGSTSTTFSHDDAGNLVDDGTFVYVYDAWNRLVKARASADSDVTIGTYAYDALGRRIKKVVTNSGDLDGTELYYYQKHQVIEVRDGSENVIRQIVHGTRYIDEVVLEILEDGVVWVHQDANWNVIALTDFAGRVLEHYYQTPYGIMTVDQESYFGDSDGDGKVTEDEWDTDEDGSLDSDDDCWGSDPSGVCRLVDFDFDNDVDATDATRLAELDSTTTYRQPGQPYSGIGNTRAHQGLIYDAEIGSFNNRMRQYHPVLKSFAQRDPVALRRNPGGGYQDGMNLYELVRSNPARYADAYGHCVSPLCASAAQRLAPVDDYTGAPLEPAAGALSCLEKQGPPPPGSVGWVPCAGMGEVVCKNGRLQASLPSICDDHESATYRCGVCSCIRTHEEGHIAQINKYYTSLAAACFTGGHEGDCVGPVGPVTPEWVIWSECCLQSESLDCLYDAYESHWGTSRWDECRDYIWPLFTAKAEWVQAVCPGEWHFVL